MEAHLFWVIIIFFTLVQYSLSAKQTYIVQMKHNSKPSSFASHSDWYSFNLQALSSDDALLYTYDAAYHGFAASLNPEQADMLRQSEHVVGVYEETIYDLHTTRTPEFLGLDSSAGFSSVAWGSLQYLNQASGEVIIGVLDTGVWPEIKSFNDDGMPEIPSRWLGECESGIDFSSDMCNKKLIGARSFSRGYRMATGGGYLKKPREPESPRDHDGHGTHTSTTAAGSAVANASLLGYATGTARGMAPYARVASYKVCWPDGCFGSDILAGIDRAILDGVDVLSMSLGGGSAPYFRDTIAMGAYTAVDKGIFVSCSAGNSGPSRASLANTAPWVMTIGAGTLDRDFPAYASLGNLNRFTGVSLYSGPGMGTNPVGLVYNKGTNGSSSLCLPGSLEPLSVRGKVVICDRGVNARVEKGGVVRAAGGVGMIIANTAASGEEMVADSHLLPTVAVGKKVGDMIKNYALSDADPTAMISFGGTVLNVKPSPVVAAFSSRGPNLVVPQILKPDVIGPGVNILAGWSESIGPTGLEEDFRKSQFNIMSGTSMSCPHISGLAALLKAAHPDWSPSAIKSALMTTAYTVDNTRAPLSDAAGGQFSNPWAHGSGHVDPSRAVSPGLIYDISSADYVAFLCSLGYTLQQVQAIAKSNATCARKYYDPGQLNYPSFSVMFGNRKAVRYTRELTNVGAARSIYKVIASGPPGVRTIVKPSVLYFANVGDKRKYTVTFVSAKVAGVRTSRSEFGSIVWANTQHLVKSPVAFAWTLLGS